ncbi:MAG TPA: serine hydrolase domain-containing protein [Gaiellaceae bacterium]|nr:serine hydrolase domain-containing protein [Gaiellaceae bacterium]
MTPLPTKLARELDGTVASGAELTPAVSLAYAENGEIVTAGWGADADTLFQAASISKSVSALVALCLVADGTLSLDGDIVESLRSWSLPPLETSTGEWRPRITVRHLLCHAAGLSVWGFPGYKRSEPLPTLLDILDGRPPANTEPVRSAGLPGLVAAYSGGGYTVLQQLIEDVTDRQYQNVAAERVLAPLGMESATFEQPVPPELEARVAIAFSHGQPIEGGWHVYPELAAAGLWCTPTDLVRFARGIQAALDSEHSAVIPQSLAAEMVTPQMPGWGLGVGLYATAEERYFGHTGGNAGYRCELVASAYQGSAAAVMTNSDEGGELVPPLLNRLVRGLGWTALENHGLIAVNSVDADFAGTYETASGALIDLESTAAGAMLRIGEQDPLPFEVVDRNTLATAEGLISITLHGDRSGTVGLTLRQREQEIFATRRG